MKALAKRLLGRHRVLVVIGVVVLATVMLSTWLTSGDQGYTDSLDPASAEPDGTRALARVLGDNGVDVRVVRSADELEDTGIDASTSVVVTATWNLGTSTLDRLRGHVAGQPLLLVDPGPDLIEELDPAIGSTTAEPSEAVEADCPEKLLTGLELATDATTTYDGVPGCFATGDGVALARGEDGLTLLGTASVLTNDEITRADNAALALRLLGQRDTLVWYVPDPADLVADDAGPLAGQLPRWLGPSLWLAALAVVLVMLWRGRRLGPLVTEPMPVVVRAVESTHGRGQLYRRGSAAAHAAGVLRTATADRLAQRLRLPRRGTDPEALAVSVAEATGRSVADVRALLAPDLTPPTDRDLIDLAQQLAALEEQVDLRR